MADLERRTLGRTGLAVSVLGFGAMELRGGRHPRGRPVEPEQAQNLLDLVLDGDINFIDTSIDYGDSEETIGRCIASRRDEYVLASKCGCLALPELMQGDPMTRPRHVFTRDNIVAGVEQSLRRLQTDHLDLVQFHASPDKSVLEQEGAIETLLGLQSQGKIRFLGSSSTLPNINDHIAMGVFDAFQIPYSALQREHEDVITAAAAAGAGTVIRGGVARGEPGEGRGNPDTWARWNAANLDDLLDGMTRMEFILRFTISHPALSTTIVGTLNPEHLAANLRAAAAGPLPAEVYEQAKKRLS